MSSKIDLFVIPLHRQDGQDQPTLPGVHTAKAPRRAARGRRKDRLVLHLLIQGDIHLRADQQKKLLEDMAGGYFKAQGSVTAALREQAERLNEYLLKHNQHHATNEQPSMALLTMIVFREERFTLAQCGPVHAFLLGENEFQHYFDPKTAGRGLGFGKKTDIRFFQSELENEKILLTMPSLPTGWNEKTLSQVQGQKISTLRRRFLGQAGAELNAVLLTAKKGKGKLHFMASSQDVEALDPHEKEREEKALPGEKEAVQVSSQLTEKRQLKERGAARSWEHIEVPAEEAPAGTPSENAEESGPIATSPLSKDADEPVPLGAKLEQSLGGFAQRILPPFRNFLLRMLPEDSSLNLPPATMAGIAALVPVIVVVLVSVIYLQVGRGQLYANYMAQAQSAAASAEARDDPLEARESWERALFYAQRAVIYQDTDEAGALRLQAQAALDDLDAVERLDFQPALFGALPDSVKITRMLATNTELYMLNATDGAVMRAFLTGGGYQLDSNFQCGPGPYGGYIVSALVDIALLPRGNPQDAALVAMDGDGNLIYCIIDGRPLAIPLEAPDSNWGNPQAISVANENLYVLDPLTNAVWIYFGEEFSFAQEPRFFFAAEVPSLQDVIDMALQDEDLYLLDLDGQTTICQFRDEPETPTTCQDPAEYTDGRAGRESGVQIEGAHFLQLQTTNPPDPSVFMLDPIVPAIYQFSLRLSLVRQYQSASTLPEGVVSAFAVSPNRAIFLAFDNQLTIGFLP